MKKLKKIFVGMFALVAVLALSFGIVACDSTEEKPDDKDPSGNETEVMVEGSYAIYFADQGGYGLELNLYENGTFYYSQYTSVITYGKYTSAAAEGTDDQGRTRYFTVTFTENDIFGDETHYIVQDAEGAVFLTNIYDEMSKATRELQLQDEPIEEIAVALSTYWSTDYETDGIKAVLYSDDTYALDGINGVGQAGSIGSYTSAEADGVTTYTLTDEDDATKVYTIVVGQTITLKLGEEDEPISMTDLDPTATPVYVFNGLVEAMGATVTMTCYDNSVCTVDISMTVPGMGDIAFADAQGTWAYQEADDIYVVTFGSETYSAEAVEGNAGSYAFEYTIHNSSFASANKVILTYTPSEATEKVTWTFVYSPVLSYAAGEKVTMTCTSDSDADMYVFTGAIWDSMPVTITCAADGTCSGEVDAMGNKVPEGTGTWSKDGDTITIIIAEVTYQATIQA